MIIGLRVLLEGSGGGGTKWGLGFGVASVRSRAWGLGFRSWSLGQGSSLNILPTHIQ